MAHGAPLEHRVWDISRFYRHTAPLERKTIPIVGARFPRPTGWGTQPLRIHSPSLPRSLSCQSFNPENPDSDNKKNLKPPHHPHRFIPTHNCRRFTQKPVFRPEPKNPAILVNFFTKKVLTDVAIRCIIGCLIILDRENCGKNQRRFQPSFPCLRGDRCGGTEGG